MTAAADEIEYVDCACYTHGRRHPEVLGSLGMTLLPFQVTGPALAAFFVTGVVMVGTWVKGGWWTWVLPTPMNALLCVIVPVTAGVVSQYIRVDGRNPLVGGLAFARYGLRTRHGVVAGRPTPRPRTHRMSARGFVCGRLR